MLYDPMNCMVDIWYFQECDKIPRRKPPKDKKNLDKCGVSRNISENQPNRSDDDLESDEI